MAEELIIPQHLSKEEKYKALIPQINALVMGETDLIANLSNIIAALKFSFNWLWVGIYFVKEEELVLGPFQGPVACTRIKKGKGVCGTSWLTQKTIIVKDVDQFPGHIACSSASQSEIVVPVFNKNSEVALVLDIDSEKLNSFDEIDSSHLSKITKLIATLL
ncbi:MAG: GAF domain-containing protein [Flavobacteriales bacterium CG_4_10_14_0_2_um_filter_32_8]|nr:MAG: GAF domain-containing protein [Flavobacteriales bacterium CG_4_10_14_0_2_um_filter_32_8]PJB16403.1 MAG: GAF domain-containing protein [Flavobacteriales bacterium CG_4_9_14_3_um_filter_32_8]